MNNETFFIIIGALMIAAIFGTMAYDKYRKWKTHQDWIKNLEQRIKKLENKG